MILNTELITNFEYWLDHYSRFGESHYKDTSIEKIQEIYYDRIVDRLLNELSEDENVDEMIERINNLF